MRALAITGMVTAAMISLISETSLIRATPPSRRMSAGTRSRAITATAPASSAILACSGVTTSMITPPLSISARPRLTRVPPVVVPLRDAPAPFSLMAATSSHRPPTEERRPGLRPILGVHRRAAAQQGRAKRRRPRPWAGRSKPCGARGGAAVSAPRQAGLDVVVQVVGRVPQHLQRDQRPDRHQDDDQRVLDHPLPRLGATLVERLVLPAVEGGGVHAGIVGSAARAIPAVGVC